MVAPPTPHQPRHGNLTARMIVGLLGLNVALLASAVDPVSDRSMLASAMLWLSAYPTWRYFARRERNIPFMPAMAAIYFCYYGLPAVRERLTMGVIVVPDAEVSVALLLALAGEALMLLAFYSKIGSGGALTRFGLELDMERCRVRMLLAAVLLAPLRFAFLIKDAPPMIDQIISVLSFFPVLLVGGLFVLYLRGQLPRQHAVMAFLLFLVLVFIDLGSGALARPMITMAVFGMLYAAERGRVPFTALVVAIAFMAPFHLIKAQFRKATWGRRDLGTIERSMIYLNMVNEYMRTDEFGGARESTKEAKERFDHLGMFAFVVSKTPSEIPYWEGHTYEDLYWSFIPRLLVPDKPKKLLGQEYGHRYKILSARDRVTSLNLEQTVEMYANFGAFGVMVGMFVLGLIYRVIYLALNSPWSGDGGRLIAVHAFCGLMAIESDFSLVFGAVLQSSVLLYLLLRIVAGKGRSEDEAQDSNLATIGAN
jgi:hypothetical protein